MNRKFLDAYNRLNNLLIKIVGAKEGDVLISYLEEISPEKIASQLKTIRQFRNAIPGHGVSVYGAMPDPPFEWIIFLEDEISFVKSHSDAIAKKINRLIALKKVKSHRDYITGKSHAAPTGNKENNELPLDVDSFDTCMTLLSSYIENKCESPVKKVIDFLEKSRDFTKVVYFIKFIENLEKSSSCKKVLEEFLFESKKIAESIKPVQFFEKSFLKKTIKFKPNNDYWLKYFNTSDFEKYLGYCNSYNVKIVIYKE